MFVQLVAVIEIVMEMANQEIKITKDEGCNFIVVHDELQILL